MAIESLDELVRRLTPDEDVHLIPVIEKELLHYDVLDALEKMGLLERLVFHGGTCLRLCYGAERRSEDLDFAYDGDLDELDLAGLANIVSGSLGRKFGLRATVKPPIRTVEFAHAAMQRWWMVVDTAPERPDLPSQKLKIELVAIKTFTREVLKVARNYDYLFPSAGNTLAVCESLEEILADKMVALVNTPPTYVRKRDLWDIMFLLSRSGVSKERAIEMVPLKMGLYGMGLSVGELAEAGVMRVNDVGTSQGFAKEMSRFMPKEAFDALFGTQMKRDFAIADAAGLYGMLRA